MKILNARYTELRSFSQNEAPSFHCLPIQMLTTSQPTLLLGNKELVLQQCLKRTTRLRRRVLLPVPEEILMPCPQVLESTCS